MIETVSNSARNWVKAFAPMALLALMWWFAGWTGEGQPSAAPEAAWLMITAAWPAALWTIAATGLGFMSRMWLLRDSHDALPLQIALGVAMMLTIDAALGALGLLQSGGGTIAWLVIGLGAALALVQCSRWLLAERQITAPPLLVWTALPALAIMFVAACSAPGWLWSTEFGGYDALSYHLQLPHEWFALGAIKPLDHNVYSFLPGYVEAAFYHLTVLRGGSIDAVYTCQMLHAMIAIAAAWVTGRFARRLAGETCGAIATVLMLGTPWVVVTGSLAYNEMAVALLLASGLLAATDEGVSPTKKGLLIGVLAGTACGAKLTAIGFVAAPLGVLLMLNVNRRGWIAAIAGGAAGGLVVLLPWLIRNGLAGGNPLFPFATGMFGLGHSTAEQAAVWTQGHRAEATLPERIVALWNQLLRFGIGANPLPGEPWKPQWLLLPWLAIAGLTAGMLNVPLHRRSAMLLLVMAMQLAFWMAFTHLQSRFLLPMVVPMSVAAALAIALPLRAVTSKTARGALGAAVALGLVAWCCVPVVIFGSEANGSPAAAIGAARHFAGEGLSSDGSDSASAMFASAFVNNAPSISPGPAARVLLVGESAPLYFDVRKVAYNTVWDRGELSSLMRGYPDDPAAWARELRSRGFAYLLINPAMLERWQRSGWNDPLITAERVLDFANKFGRLRQRFPRGELLFEINPNGETTETVPLAAVAPIRNRPA